MMYVFDLLVFYISKYYIDSQVIMAACSQLIKPHPLIKFLQYNTVYSVISILEYRSWQH